MQLHLALLPMRFCGLESVVDNKDADSSSGRPWFSVAITGFSSLIRTACQQPLSHRPDTNFQTDDKLETPCIKQTNSYGKVIEFVQAT
jgi:hypothetical protein